MAPSYREHFSASGLDLNLKNTPTRVCRVFSFIKGVYVVVCIMDRILYQIYPSDTNISYDPPPVTTVSKGSSQTDFGKVVVALVIILVSVGVFYLAYSLFLKDCILLFKAKKQRTTTEIGFGQTPARNQDHPQP